MVAVEVLETWEAVITEAVAAVQEAYEDPGYDVEFREDLDGVYTEDRDINNLAAIEMAVRSGLPVTGWKPALRNPGNQERVDRATTQFVRAAKGYLKEYESGGRPAESTSTAIASAYMRQARNAFIAGKRALGNLAPLTTNDEADIRRSAAAIGLAGNPAEDNFGGFLMQALQGDNAPADARDAITGYIEGLMATMTRAGFASAADEQRTATQALLTAAVSGRTDAEAAYYAARDSQAPDLETWRQQFVAARDVEQKHKDALKRLQNAQMEAEASGLVSDIKKAQEGATARLNKRLGILLRKVLGNRITPGEALAEFRSIMTEEARKSYVSGRKRGGKKRPGKKPTAEEAMAADEEEEDFEDAWVYAGIAATAALGGAAGYGLYNLLSDVIFDPLNLVDPDVYQFVARRLDNVAAKFHHLNQLGQKAAFKVGGSSLPAPSPVDGNVYKDLASKWEDSPGPVADPTPLGDAVLVWWRLGNSVQHCPDCINLAASSPYKADEVEYMGLAPGSGHTQCGAFCHCSLEFDVPSTVCVDGIVVQESMGGSLENVAVMEAENCENHMDISGLTVAGLGFQADEIQMLGDDVAFDWDADVAANIVLDQPGVGVPAQRAWLAEAPPPGNPPFVRRPGSPGGVGPVLTQKFRYGDDTYTAVFQSDDDAVRFISGFIDDGSDVAFENELTVAAMRYLSTSAAETGKALHFDPRLINPGMRSFLDEIGATVPDFPARSILPRGAGGPPVAQRVLEWPGTEIPRAMRPTTLPAVSGQIPFPVYNDAWTFVDELEYVSNGKGVRQEFYHYIGDRGSLERYWNNEFGITIENIDDWTTAQLNDITARLEFFRDIGIDTSIFKRLRTITDGSFAGEALSDGTIKMSNTIGLGAKHTYASSIGDTFAHEFAHLVDYEYTKVVGKQLDLSVQIGRDFTPYGSWSYRENFAETWSAMFRPDYRAGTMAGDEAVWLAMREAGIVRDPPLRIKRVDLPPAPTGVSDELGNLNPGWRFDDETLRGSVTLRTLVGPDGLRYVFKPGAAEEEIAGAAVTRLFGFNAPDIGRARIDGEWGIVYPYIGDVTTLGPEFDALEMAVAESLITDPIESFSHAETRELFGHHLVDWLINNHDGHAGNILRQGDGSLIAIDKGRGFTIIGIRSDQTLLGATTGGDAYNGLIPAMLRTQKNADGTNAGLVLMRMLEPEDVRQVLARFDSVSDESFERLISGIPDDVKAGLMQRKQALRADTEEMFSRIIARYPDSVSDEWAKWDGTFKQVRMKAPDDIKKALTLRVDEIAAPKNSGFFKNNTPAEVKKAIDALPEAQRAEAEKLIRNVVSTWKKDFTVIPQDWQVWSLRGGTFKTPSLVTPPSFGMSKPGAYIAKVQGKPYVPKPPKYVPTTAVGYASDTPPPSFWGGLGDLTPKHPDGSKPPTPWDGDEWRIPRNGPMGEAGLVEDIGYDIDINAPLKEWSGDVPFDEPPLPDGIILDHQKKAAEEAADKAFKTWEDVKSGDVDYARVWGGKTDVLAAEKAGLLSERMADGNIYVTTSKRRLKALREAIGDGMDTNSDHFWVSWLGHTEADLEAIDYYEDVKNWKSIRAGVLVVEDDGAVWFMAPRNQFAGYENTFSKGGIDPGETVAEGAVREAREEMGLSVEITGYLGDYENKEGSSLNRYFIGRRTGGGPAFASRKETYAMRLGMPEEIMPMLKRHGQPDVRDTKVLDDLNAVLGNPPLEKAEPRHLGFSLNDPPDYGPNTMLEGIEYDPDYAGLLAEMAVNPAADGKFIDSITYVPNGELKVKVKHVPGAQTEIWVDDVWKVLDGGTWGSLEGNEIVAAFLGFSKPMQDGQTLRIEAGAFNAAMDPIYKAFGIESDLFGHVVLDSDEVAAIRSALTNGVLPAKGPPSVVLSTGQAGDLATKLSPTDPLAAVVKGGDESFTGAFGMTKEGLEDAGKNFQPGFTQASIVKADADTSLYAFTYSAPSGPVNMSYSFGSTGATPVVLEDVLWASAATVQDKKNHLTAALKHFSDTSLNVSESSWNAVHIPASLVTDAQMDEMLTSLGASLSDDGQMWLFDDTAMANLIKGVDSDVLVEPVAYVGAKPLNHMEQATAANPMVAHTPPKTSPTIIDPVPTSQTPVTATTWKSDPDLSYKFVKAEGGQKHWHEVGLSGSEYQSQFYVFDQLPPGDVYNDLSQYAIKVEWQLTKTGNIHITGLVVPQGVLGLTDDIGMDIDAALASAMQGFINDSADLMKVPMPTFTKHNAITMSEDVWQGLPNNVKNALEDYSHTGYKNNQVVGKAKALDLDSTINAGLDGYAPGAGDSLVGFDAIPDEGLPVAPVVTQTAVPNMPAMDETLQYDLAWVNSPIDANVSPTGAIVTVNLNANAVGQNTNLTKWSKVDADHYVLLPSAEDPLDGTLLPMSVNDFIIAIKGMDGVPTTGTVKFGIPSDLASEQWMITDLLKQVGAHVDEQGTVWMTKNHVTKFSDHIANNTWPVTSTGAVPAQPPGSAIIDAVGLDASQMDSAKSVFDMTPEIDVIEQTTEGGNVLYKHQISGEWSTGVNSMSTTNVEFVTAVYPPSSATNPKTTDTVILSLLPQTQQPGKGFTMHGDVWTKLSPKTQDALLQYPHVDLGNEVISWSPDAAKQIVDDLLNEFGVNPMKAMPPNLPKATTIFGAGDFDTFFPDMLQNAPTGTTTFHHADSVKVEYTLAQGSNYKVYGEQVQGNEFIMLVDGNNIHSLKSEGSFELTGVLHYHGSLNKPPTLIIHSSYKDNLPPEYVDMLKALGASENEFGHILLEPDALSNFSSHLDAELVAKAGPTEPVIPQGVVGGQTVATPADAVLPPDLLDIEDYDALTAIDVKQGAKTKVKDWPGIKAAHNPINSQAYEKGGSEIGFAYWRRLGNRLEFYGATTPEAGVAQLKALRQMLIDNPKLTHITIKDTTGWQATFPKFNDFVQGYVPADGKVTKGLLDDMWLALDDDYQKADAFTKAPPPQAAPTSPFASVDGYNPNNVVTTTPVSTSTIEPPYLASQYKKKATQDVYGGGNAKTVIEYRRIGNRIETFQIVPQHSDNAVFREHVLAHIKNQTDLVVDNEKLTDIRFIHPDLLPPDIRAALEAMGAETTTKGYLKVDRKAAIAINDALKGDALTPGAPVASVVTPPPPPAPPVQTVTAPVAPPDIPTTPVQAPVAEPFDAEKVQQAVDDNWLKWTPEQHSAQIWHDGLITKKALSVAGAGPDSKSSAQFVWLLGGEQKLMADISTDSAHKVVTLIDITTHIPESGYSTGAIIGAIQATAAKGQNWQLRINDEIVTLTNQTQMLESLGFTKQAMPDGTFWMFGGDGLQHAGKTLDNLPSQALADPNGLQKAEDIVPAAKEKVPLPGQQPFPAVGIEDYPYNEQTKIAKVAAGETKGNVEKVTLQIFLDPGEPGSSIEVFTKKWGKGVLVKYNGGFSTADKNTILSIHKAIWDQYGDVDILWDSSFFHDMSASDKLVWNTLKDIGGVEAVALDGSSSWYTYYKVTPDNKTAVLEAMQPKFFPEQIVTGDLLQKGSTLYDEGSAGLKTFQKGTTKVPHVQGKHLPVKKLSLTKGNHGYSAKLEFSQTGNIMSAATWTDVPGAAQNIGFYHLAKMAGDGNYTLFMPLDTPALKSQLKNWATTFGQKLPDDAVTVTFTPEQAKVIVSLMDQNIVPKAGVVPIFEQPNTAFVVGKVGKSKAKGKVPYWGGDWTFTMQGKAYGLTGKYGSGGSGKVILDFYGSANNPKHVFYKIDNWKVTQADEEAVFWGGFLKSMEYLDGTIDEAVPAKWTTVRMVPPNQHIADVLAAMGGVPVTSDYGHKVYYDFTPEQLRKVKKAIQKGTLPEGTSFVPTPAAAAPTPSPAAATTTPTPTPPPAPAVASPAAPAAPEPPKAAKKKADEPPPIPKPDTTIWVPPKQGAAVQSTTSPVPVPDTKSMSKKYGYDHEEMKQFEALGASEINVGSVTTNVEPQDAYAYQFITPGGNTIKAQFARSPNNKTVAFTGIDVAPNVSPERAEAAWWASLYELANEAATKKAGDVPMGDSKLYITNEMLAARPELKQQLIDMGAVEFLADDTGAELRVFAPALGLDVTTSTPVPVGALTGDKGIKGRGFWRAYGDGLFLDRETSQKLAAAIDTGTFDEALQVDVLAAKPPDPITQTKKFPQGVPESNPIGYMEIHPDHLYLARNEHIKQHGPRAVSEWAGGKVQAEWLRTPSILHWETLTIADGATETEVRASVIRNLRNLAEQQMATPGMAMDIKGPVLDTMPELQDLLLRWNGRLVGSGEKRFIRMNYQDSQTFFLQFNAELKGIKPRGGVRPVVDPPIWPSPKELTLKEGAKLKGQTKKLVFTDLDGTEWLFKPGRTGRGTHADVATYQLSQHMGLYVPPVKTYTLTVDGKPVQGSLQHFVPAKTIGKKSDHLAALDSLTDDQTEQLFQHSVLDRLIANDDSHLENFLIGADGQLWAIDKTRAWKGMGRADDSLDIAREGRGGVFGLPPLINLFWREAQKNPAMLEKVSPRAMGRILRHVDNIPEEEFLRIVDSVIDDVAEMEKRWGSKEAFREAMLARKRGLQNEYNTHFKRQLQQMLDSGKTLPDEWQAFMDNGAEFQLIASPHEEGAERLELLRKKLGITDELDDVARQYPDAAAFHKDLVQKLYKRAPAEVKKEVTAVSTRAHAYSGGGTSVTDEAGNTIMSKGFGAEGIPQGGIRGYEHMSDVNEMLILSIIHDPDFTVPGWEDAIKQVRSSYNEESGELIIRRGVREYKVYGPDPNNPGREKLLSSRSLSSEADAKFYWEKVQDRGFRPVLGTSWGANQSGFAGGSVQITAKVEPRQMFMSTFFSGPQYGGNKFSHPGEREIIIRDLTVENIIRVDKGSHSWPSEFGMPYRSEEQMRAVFERLWELDGGPVVGPY